MGVLRDHNKAPIKPAGEPRFSSVHLNQGLPAFGVSCLALESRIMFDGAAVATVDTVATEQLAQSQAFVSPDDATTVETSYNTAPKGEPQFSSGDQALFDALAAYDASVVRHEVVFISPSVREYQHLLDGISPNVQVFMLDDRRDGVEQMSEILTGRRGIDAIHIISHGAPAELTLGTAQLTLNSMNGAHADALAVIGQSLSENADILIYGCNFGLGQDGAEATTRLGQLTGADVAVSTDNTGHASLGGDWDLEYEVGRIETVQAFTMEAKQNWSHLLVTETVLDNFSSASYSNNDGSQAWSADWVETDGGGAGPGAGEIQVTGGALFIDVSLGAGGNNIHREVNLAGALSATLTYSYTQSLAVGGTIEVQISNNGGANYTTLETYTSLFPVSGSGTFDVTSYISANTRLRFEVTGTGLFGNIQFDDVEISYLTNDAPVITNLASDSLSYNEGDGAVAIDQGGNATVSDTDSANFDTGTLTVSFAAGSDASEDVLAIRNQGSGAGQIGFSGSTVTYGGTTIGTVAGGTGGSNLVVTFNSNATPAAAQALIQNITYENTDTDNPTTGVRTVRFVLSDGDGGSSGDHDANVTVSTVNDAPAITSSGGGATAAITVVENQVTGTTITSVDVDGGPPVYSIIGGADAALFSIDATSGVLTFNSAPDFEAPVDAGANNVYDVTVRVADGNGGIDVQALSITVTDVVEGISPSTPPPLIPPSLVPQPPVTPPGVGVPPLGSPPLPPGVVNPPISPRVDSGVAPAPTVSGNDSSAVAAADQALKMPASGPKDGTTQAPSVHPLRETSGHVEEETMPFVYPNLKETARTFGIQTVEKAPGPLSEAFRRALSLLDEDLRQSADLSETHKQLLIRAMNMGGITLTAGVITWLLRSGFLLASLAATMPAWRHFDPLPVVLVSDRKRRKSKADMAAAAEVENKQFRGLRNLLDNKGDEKDSQSGDRAT